MLNAIPQEILTRNTRVKDAFLNAVNKKGWVNLYQYISFNLCFVTSESSILICENL